MNSINLSNRTNYLFAIFGVFLILMPKVNVIPVAGQSAGIRVDDIIIMISLFVYMLAFYTSGRILSAKNYFYFVVYILVSTAFLYIVNKSSNMLYALRMLEYYMFFVFGWSAFGRFDIKNIVKLVFIFNTVVMILQYFGLIGGFASGGYASAVDDRVIGLTGGPWEVGFIINCVYVILRQEKHSTSWNLLLFTVTFLFVLLTGARMPTLAHLIAFIVIEYKGAKNKSFFFLCVTSLLSLILLLLMMTDNPVRERSVHLFSMRNIDIFMEFYRTVDVNGYFSGFPTFPFDNAADLSWLMRVSKWAYAFKSWSLNIFSILFGVGAGTWGVALDGGWLRLLSETGVIGLSLFLSFLVKAGSYIPLGFPIQLVFFINMLMIDIYISYKSMAIILFISGYYASLHRNRKLMTEGLFCEAS